VRLAMKSIFIALVFILAFTMALTSCGGNSTGSSEPTNQGPMAGAPSQGTHLANQNPSFNWQSMGAEIKYEFQLSTKQDFSTMTFTNFVTTPADKVPDTMKLDHGTTYYWRVRVTEPDPTKWSDVSSFTVD
jgi:hypothetical protein